MLEPEEAYRIWAPSYETNPLMAAEERVLRSMLPELAGLSVLDAACGTGRYLRIARSLGARLVVGADLVGEMLGRAPGPCRVLARLEALPFQAAWADLTICALALGYVGDLEQALTELARVTRPGGRILCSDLHPVGRTLGWRRELRIGSRLHAIRHHWHELSDWARAVSSAGLRQTEMLEAHLLPGDRRPEPGFDLRTPVALVLELRHSL